MRVTSFGIDTQYIQNLNNIMQSFQTYENELSTGKKLNQPSDNPVAASADIQTQAMESQVKQWISNTKSAYSGMQTTDAAMSNLETTLGNVRTQLVQAVNGTNDQTDLTSIQSNIKQELQAVQQIANTNNGQQYIFAGTQGETQPVPGTGSSAQWAFSASPADQTITIGAGVKVQTNVNGQDMFASVPTGSVASPSGSTAALFSNSSGTTGLLQQIVNDLNSPANIANLKTDLTNLDANINNVITKRSGLGGRMNLVSSTQTQLEQTSTSLQTQQGNLENANIAKVSVQFTTEQAVYQAALNAGQNIILPTLAEKL